MTRLDWPIRNRADSGLGLNGFPILPLHEYPAHTKVNDRASKSRRTKERKKARLSTKVKPSASHNETDLASSWILPIKKTKQNSRPQPCAMTPTTLTLLGVISVTTTRGHQPLRSYINHNSTIKIKKLTCSQN